MNETATVLNTFFGWFIDPELRLIAILSFLIGFALGGLFGGVAKMIFYFFVDRKTQRRSEEARRRDEEARRLDEAARRKYEADMLAEERRRGDIAAKELDLKERIAKQEIKDKQAARRLESCRKRKEEMEEAERRKKEERDREFKQIDAAYKDTLVKGPYKAIAATDNHIRVAQKVETNMKNIYDELRKTLEEYDRRKNDKDFREYMKTTKYGTEFLDSVQEILVKQPNYKI